jgi:putative redox protein
MGEEVEVKAALTNEKIQFTSVARSNPAIICDYKPPLGDGEGYTGLELLLTSLAVCSGSTLVFLLRKMRKTVTGLEVHAKGIRREQHPTSFETISLEFTLHSPDANDGDMQKVVQLSEETYCPVWAMLKNNVEVTTSCSVVGPA